jgi:hypothetical protein
VALAARSIRALNADMGVGSESGLTLLQYGTVNGETQYTAISDNEGALTWTLGKGPSNSLNAAVDGSVTVVATTDTGSPEVVAPAGQTPVVVMPVVVQPVRRVLPMTPVSQPVSRAAASGASVPLVMPLSIETPTPRQTHLSPT